MAVVILGGPTPAMTAPTMQPATPAPAGQPTLNLAPGANEQQIVRAMTDAIVGDSSLSGAVQQLGGRGGVELFLNYTRGNLDEQQSQVFDKIIGPTFGGMNGVLDYATGVISNMGGAAGVEQLARAIREQVAGGGGTHVQPTAMTGWSPGDSQSSLVNQVTGFVQNMAGQGGPLGTQLQAAIDQVGGAQGVGLMVEQVLNGMGGSNALAGLADSFAQTAQSNGGGAQAMLGGLLGGGGMGGLLGGLGGGGLDGLLGGMMGGILGA